jgi:Tfp pilus assembly ATPase PilU
VLTEIFPESSSAEFERAHFSAKNSRGKPKDWDVRPRVLDLLNDGSTRTFKEIMERAGVRSRTAADNRLHRLVNDGSIERADRGAYRRAARVAS